MVRNELPASLGTADADRDLRSLFSMSAIPPWYEANLIPGVQQERPTEDERRSRTGLDTLSATTLYDDGPTPETSSSNYEPCPRRAGRPLG